MSTPQDTASGDEKQVTPGKIQSIPGHNGRPVTLSREHAESLADWTLSHIIVRLDAFGYYTPDGRQFTAHEPLTRDILIAHYLGERTIGVHSTSADNRCRCLVGDVDAHDEQADPERNFACARSIVVKLREWNLDALLGDSSGKGGFHVRAIFKSPVPADVAYWLGKTVNDHLVANGFAAVEFFPKQAAVTLDHPYGNWVRLPGKHHKRDHWMRFWDPKTDRWLEGEEAFQFLSRVRGSKTDWLLNTYKAANPVGSNGQSGSRRKGRRASALDLPDEDKVRAALAFVPDADADGYDRWLAVGMCLHDWDPGRGLDLWHEWSNKNGKYDPAVCDEKWTTFTAGGGLTIATVFKSAADHGWSWTPRPSVNGDGDGDGTPRVIRGAARVPGNSANFTAVITKEVTRHEAGSRTKEFVIEATRTDDGKVVTVTAPAAEFAAMGWVEAMLGAGWIIDAGRGARDMVREQIAKASLGLTRFEDVYTAIGWVETADGWFYVHADGAIGAAGSVPGVRVEVASALAGYVLSDPPSGDALRAALEARWRFADLGRASRPGAPAVASVVLTLPARAALSPLNVTVHFSGPSGTRKTTVALLVQGCFSVVPPPGEERTTTSWEGTANGIQRLTHDCGDSVVVIDELTGEKAAATATGVIQSQGNLKGRDRMTRDLRIAPGLDPRGSILSTGETKPGRNSTLGRMLVIPFEADTVDDRVLTICQKDIAAGLHRQVTAAYVRWLAQDGRIARERATLSGRVTAIANEIRNLPGVEGVHPRTPRAIAELLASYEVFLRFAQDVGGLPAVTAAAYRSNAQGGLLSLIGDQQMTHEESTPAVRFLELLRAALTSKRYHLNHTDPKHHPGDEYAAACGWEHVEGAIGWRVPSGSTAIGYIDPVERRIYLDPTQAKEVARNKGLASGQPYENPESLARDLDAAGLILTTTAGEKRRRTLLKRIGTSVARYLTFEIATIFGDEDVTTVTTR